MVEDVKVVQESLRHANFHITMDTYAQAVPGAVRAAHERVVEELTAEAEEEKAVSSGPIIGPRLDPSASVFGGVVDAW
jgi:hypothetical protein